MDSSSNQNAGLCYVNGYFDGRLLLFFLPIVRSPSSPAVQQQILGTNDNTLHKYDIVFPTVNHRPVSIARVKTDTFRPDTINGTTVQLAIFAEANVDEADAVICQSTLASNNQGLQTYADRRMTIKDQMNEIGVVRTHEAYITAFWEVLRKLQDKINHPLPDGGSVPSFEDACFRLYEDLTTNSGEFAVPEHLVNAPWFSKCQFCLQVMHPFRVGIIDGGHRLTWMYIQASMMAVLKIDVEGNEEYIVTQRPAYIRDGKSNLEKIELLVQVCVASSKMSTEDYRKHCLDTSDSLVQRENLAIPGETIHEYV
jgi:hypothetical protein